MLTLGSIIVPSAETTIRLLIATMDLSARMHGSRDKCTHRTYLLFFQNLDTMCIWHDVPETCYSIAERKSCMYRDYLAL